MKLSKDETEEIQRKYRDLVNYVSQDPDDPIDPLTYVDSNGDSLLHIAAQRGDLRTVELLLGAGLDANQLGDMGNTPLHYASTREVSELLVKSGASREVENEFGRRPPVL